MTPILLAVLVAAGLSIGAGRRAQRFLSDLRSSTTTTRRIVRLSLINRHDLPLCHCLPGSNRAL
jgi:hypothetical protein